MAKSLTIACRKFADMEIVSNTTTNLIPDDKEEGQPHAPCNDNLMLLVQHVCNGTLDCSVISTKDNSFKVLQQDDDDDDDNLPNLSLLKADNYDPLNPKTDYDVVASCDSWMLLTCNKNPECPWDLLWDPTTDERISLPCFSLASPRMTSVWAYGFGFDPQGGYKVVRCRVRGFLTREPKLYIELLSLASGSRKEIPCPPYLFFDTHQSPSLHINGFYYWTNNCGIVSFDFAKEEFSPALIPMPESNTLNRGTADLVEFYGPPKSSNLNWGTADLVEFDGSLAVIVYEVDFRERDIYAADEPFIFELWVWKAPRWSHVYTREVPAAADIFSVIGLYRNDKPLLRSWNGDLLLYEIEEKGLKNLGIRDDFTTVRVFPYFANAESKLRSSINLPSGASNVVASVPATIRALTRNLKHNNNNSNLMLMVQCVLNWTRNYFVLSMENKMFKVVQDKNSLPNLSLLKAQNYDPVCMNAKYHVQASCNTWMLWTCIENIASPVALLWDPRTDVLVTLPFFEAVPRVRCPIYTSMWGYGIGCASGEYKVVRCRVFEYFRSNREAHAELFSLETCSWKEIQYPHDPHFEAFQHPSLHINGFYYWLAAHATKRYLAVISFDFGNEEFPHALIPMPESKMLGKIMLGCVSLAEVHGSLAAIVFDKSSNIDDCPRPRPRKNRMNTSEKAAAEPFIFEIWVWNDGIWSYESKHTVVTPHPYAGVVYRRVVGLYMDHKAFLQDSAGYLWLYDCKTEDLELFGGIRDDTCALVVYPYV